MSLHGFTNFDDEIGAIGLGNLTGRATNNQSLSNNVDLGGTDGLGGNIWGKGGVASMALGGLETLGNLWGAFQQNKLARMSLSLQKKAFKTNLANSTKVYNTALEDRIRARYATEGRPEQADAYIDRNRLGGSGNPTGRRINIEE